MYGIHKDRSSSEVGPRWVFILAGLLEDEHFKALLKFFFVHGTIVRHIEILEALNKKEFVFIRIRSIIFKIAKINLELSLWFKCYHGTKL